MNVIHRINSLKKKMISIVTEKRNWQNTAPILHLKINTHTKKNTSQESRNRMELPKPVTGLL